MTTRASAVDREALYPDLGTIARHDPVFHVRWVVVTALLVTLYFQSFREMYGNWFLPDSYYSHGVLVPFISLFFAWRDRRRILAAPHEPNTLGYPLILMSAFLLLLGDFLGFRVFGHISLIPMLFGVSLLLLGTQATRLLWFPLLFLVFMVPIPPSLTQSIALKLKLAATTMAVQLANLATLPMVREGSFIHFNGDQLLVGEVCGGLRSLIALLAFGAIMAFISKTRPWARVLLLIMSAPIAIISNVVRIFLLCVVGYFWGSDVAAGKFHDISGILIFVIAFILFMALEGLLRKVAPARDDEPEPPRPAAGGARSSVGATRRFGHLAAIVALLLPITTLHLVILNKQAEAGTRLPPSETLNIPSRIAGYEQVGPDVEVEDYVKELLETSTILIRNYEAPNRRILQLSIVYAGSTRRSLHFPEVCLVGNGFDIVQQEPTEVGVAFSARRLLLVRGHEQHAVLYWFKTEDRFTGSFFVNAAQWAKNQLTFQAPTSAMIKLTAVVGADGTEAAFSALEDFAIKLGPILLEQVR
jgi:EpsI family protein